MQNNINIYLHFSNAYVHLSVHTLKLMIKNKTKENIKLEKIKFKAQLENQNI